ncbi:PQQ-dependent sugar dehydrogenase [Cytobacillus solani]|uniref:Quinoprotein glucose dehydrogenase n=1 Tax=Cytobacillus solani TaxID=1637975 RepID=A0A0Q3TEP6_9BACI|nr:PQQ-dependent sugar dehydrogenase [Cytobacillus solani]KQL21589.1 quinoprotein glucose dehydrogenase [Cytobacillus solani]USK54899.1 PQQ-dependent sugar dehydrogenase [Cytobacillus solani]
MKRVLTSLIILFAIVGAGCSQIEEKGQEVDQEASLPYKEPKVIADGLQIPWSIDQSEGIFYLSERPGHIVKIEEEKAERQKVVLEQPLATAAEAGLLGFVLSPDFSKTKEAFAYYTYTDGSGQFNRIVLLKQDNGTWKETRLLLDQIPSGQFHHGGRIEIGPDGKLYATTGDASNEPEIAQDIHSLGGKILRMNLDGSIPADNPIQDSYVYTYGHRNPQGLAWTKDGMLYESEHGPSANDEVNLIQPGHNYGWPLIKGKESKEGLETPLFTSGDSATWAPSGMAFYEGKLYAAALRGSAVLEFDLKSKKMREAITGLGRIRDVYIKDGFLYFVSNNTDGRGTPLEKDDKLYQIPLADL